ncbi:hypothetical protein AB5J52_01250 [Streptomyces sp. R39]|uniref:Uncharacterized protein n=1 Tax=Streptomyces sp. R39 TaxID=3238631 RepID=A0AB39QFB2_9ACTN
MGVDRQARRSGPSTGPSVSAEDSAVPAPRAVKDVSNAALARTAFRVRAVAPSTASTPAVSAWAMSGRPQRRAEAAAAVNRRERSGAVGLSSPARCQARRAPRKSPRAAASSASAASIAARFGTARPPPPGLYAGS